MKNTYMFDDIRRIQDVPVDGKTVLVRTNFDVKLENEEIVDNSRIQAAVETIQYLVEKKCKVVVITHLGEPNSEVNDALSLMPVRFELGKLLNKPIKFAHLTACENSIKFMEEGEVLMIENLKFYNAETTKNEQEKLEGFKVLAELCHYYVNEAFGITEELTSLIELPQMIPSFAGLHLQKELESLKTLEVKKNDNFVVILGGKSIDHKIEMLNKWKDSIDTLLIGGEIAYEFLAADEVKVGKFKPSHTKELKKVLNDLRKAKVEIILPVDHIATKSLEEKPEIIDKQAIPSGLLGVDIGPKTLELFRERIESAGTILWNGPVGVFEIEAFDRGTEAIGEYIGLSASKDAYKLAVGTDTLYAMNKLRIKSKRFNHTSVSGQMAMSILAGNSFSSLNLLIGKQSV